MLTDRWLKVLSIVLLAAVTCCKSTEKPEASEARGFGWEEDLTLPPPTAPACGDGTAKAEGEKSPQVCDLKKVNKYDKRFCASEAPGSCFSLVIRIPFTDLQSDYGLTALSLTSTNPNTYARLTEACQTAWLQFQNRYRSDGLKPLRKQFVSNVKKMRCIYNFFSSEYTEEDLQLADEELALSMRLSKFAIEGQNTAATVNALSLKADTTKVTVNYRNVFSYSGKKVHNGTGAWRRIDSLSKPSYQLSRKLEQSISWNFDLAALQASLGKIDVAAITEPSLRDFIIKSKDTVTSALSGNYSNLGGSIAMLGMGYQAVKAICGEGGSGCKVESQTTPVLNDQNATLATFVPNSAINEAVRLSLIKSIEGLLDSYFEQADPKAVRTWLGG